MIFITEHMFSVESICSIYAMIASCDGVCKNKKSSTEVRKYGTVNRQK